MTNGIKCGANQNLAKQKRAKPSQASHPGNFGTDGLVNVKIGSVIANKSFELEQ